MPKLPGLAIALFGFAAAAAAVADDIRPEVRAQVESARPLADEKCIEQCDVASDTCMQDAAGDSGKVQVCDEKYSECLQKCEGG